jgi:hypothetical protein
MSDALPVVLFALLVLMLAAACGAGLDSVHAGIARSALEAQVEMEPVIREARRDAMTEAVDRVHGSGGTREQAQVASDAAARAWRCAIDGHRGFGTVVGTYVDALWLEKESGGDYALADFLPFVRRILDAYRATASCVSSLGDFELPVPAFLDLLPPLWGIGGE